MFAVSFAPEESPGRRSETASLQVIEEMLEPYSLGRKLSSMNKTEWRRQIQKLLLKNVNHIVNNRTALVFFFYNGVACINIKNMHYLY